VAGADSEEEGATAGGEVLEDESAFGAESVALAGVGEGEDLRGRPRRRGVLAVLVETGADVLGLANIHTGSVFVEECIEARLNSAWEVSFGEEVGEPEIEQPSDFGCGVRGGVAWGGLGLFC
jgi:hypothetical protein